METQTSNTVSPIESSSNGSGILPPYEEMIKAGMHFGRKRTIFHPNMGPFVYTLKDGIHILDLIKTGDYLLKAIDFLKKSLAEGKLVLLVGLTKQSAEVIKATAEALNLPYVINRWLGGTLTNYKTIISRVKYLEDLEKKQAGGDFEKYTKRERVLKEREITALRQKFDGLRKLTRLPDVIFVSSLKEGQLPVREAKVTKIKVVAMVNTDSDPKQVDYPIPANDNSKRAAELILEAIRKGVQTD